MSNNKKGYQLFVYDVDGSQDKIGLYLYRSERNSLSQQATLKQISEELKNNFVDNNGVFGMFLPNEQRYISDPSPFSMSGENEVYFDKTNTNYSGWLAHEIYGHAWFDFNGLDYRHGNSKLDIECNKSFKNATKKH